MAGSTIAKTAIQIIIRKYFLIFSTELKISFALRLFFQFSASSWARTFKSISESEFVLKCLKSCSNISLANFFVLIRFQLCANTIQ